MDEVLLLQERQSLFWRNVSLSPGCWTWTGTTIYSGYGRTKIGGRKRAAHRVAWVLAHGRPIPPGLEVDHLCRNRACVRPTHLEAVTREENQARKVRKTHCKWGHEYTAIRKDNGRRVCNVCNRKSVRRANRAT